MGGTTRRGVMVCDRRARSDSSGAGDMDRRGEEATGERAGSGAAAVEGMSWPFVLDTGTGGGDGERAPPISPASSSSRLTSAKPWWSRAPDDKSRDSCPPASCISVSPMSPAESESSTRSCMPAPMSPASKSRSSCTGEAMGLEVAAPISPAAGEDGERGLTVSMERPEGNSKRTSSMRVSRTLACRRGWVLVVVLGVLSRDETRCRGFRRLGGVDVACLNANSCLWAVWSSLDRWTHRRPMASARQVLLCTTASEFGRQWPCRK